MMLHKKEIRGLFVLGLCLVFLQGCAFFRWVGLAGELDEKSPGDHLVELSRQLDVEMSQFNVNTLERILDFEATRFVGGKILRGKKAILEADKRELASYRTSGLKPNCCTYPEVHSVRVENNTGVVTYVVRMEWPTDQTMVGYLGYVTRIFIKKGDNWYLQHYQIAWHS